jgi:two-component system, OmpR family, aerobic respiration control sensor histidine kinase ArcB
MHSMDEHHNTTAEPSMNMLLKRCMELEYIINQVPAHIYWKEKDSGKYLGCNNQQARRLGFKTGESIKGKTDFDLPWAEQAHELYAIDSKVIQSNTPLETEELLNISEHEKATFLSKKIPFPLPGSNEILGVLGISINITQLKNKTQQLNTILSNLKISNELKEKIIQNMHHEFTATLHHISHLAKLLHDKIQDPNLAEYSNMLLESSNTLCKRFEEIIESTSDIKNNQPICHKPFNYQSSLKSIVDLHQEEANAKGITLQFIAKHTTSAIIIADKQHIQNIALELLAHTLKHSSQGKIVLEVRVYQTSQSKNILECCVINQVNNKLDPRKEPLEADHFDDSEHELEHIQSMLEEIEGKITIANIPGSRRMIICQIPCKSSLVEAFHI